MESRPARLGSSLKDKDRQSRQENMIRRYISSLQACHPIKTAFCPGLISSPANTTLKKLDDYGIYKIGIIIQQIGVCFINCANVASIYTMHLLPETDTSFEPQKLGLNTIRVMPSKTAIATNGLSKSSSRTRSRSPWRERRSSPDTRLKSEESKESL